MCVFNWNNHPNVNLGELIRNNVVVIFGVPNFGRGINLSDYISVKGHFSWSFYFLYVSGIINSHIFNYILVSISSELLKEPVMCTRDVISAPAGARRGGRERSTGNHSQDHLQKDFCYA